MAEKRLQASEKSLKKFEESKWYNEYKNQEFFIILLMADTMPDESLKSSELIDYIFNYLKTSSRVGVINRQLLFNIHMIMNINLSVNYSLSDEERNKCFEILKMLEYIEYNDSNLSRIEEEFVDRTVIDDQVKLRFSNSKDILETLYDSYYSDYLLYQILFEYETEGNLIMENYKSLVLSKGTILSIISLINNHRDKLDDDEIRILSDILNYKTLLSKDYPKELKLSDYLDVDTGESVIFKFSEDELKLVDSEFNNIIYQLIDLLYSEPNKTYKVSKILC